MKFEKGNKIGHRFTADNQPTPEAKKSGRVDRVALFLASVNVKPLTAEEVSAIDTSLLSMTRDELAALCRDTRQPIIVQARAKQLMEKATTFDGCEKLLDRSFGKPTQRTEQQIESSGVTINFSNGGGRPARDTEKGE